MTGCDEQRSNIDQVEPTLRHATSKGKQRK
jgi:hypothetical protein